MQMVVMWVIGGLLIYLAIAKKMEPSLLLPMGFGAILVNLPLSGAITQGTTVGPISALFDAGMSNELFPLLLFIGIGAMIDFGPAAGKAVAHAVRCGGAVRHFCHTRAGGAVL